jgi:1-deoxy-D-xylulose-5-phosphate synthase
VFDFSFMRHLPGLTFMAPKDENELRSMLKTALDLNGPVALRYPRGAGYGVALDDTIRTLPVGRAELLREGADLAIIAIGSTVMPAVKAAGQLAAQGINTAVVNARFIKPLDADLILGQARATGRIITVEENSLQGGFGSAVLELLQDNNMSQTRVKRLGIPDHYIEQGSQARLRKDAGIDAEGITSAALAFMKQHV